MIPKERVHKLSRMRKVSWKEVPVRRGPLARDYIICAVAEFRRSAPDEKPHTAEPTGERERYTRI